MTALETKLVIDSSAIFDMIFPHEGTPYGKALKEAVRNCRIMVPALFFYEIVNVLLMQVRRGKATSAEMLSTIENIRTVAEDVVDIGDLASLAALAERHTLTAYDASYLAVAQRYHAPLATLDTALKKAAIAENLFYNPSP